MASENLSLLFQLRAQNQTAPAFKAVQADALQLKTKFGSEFGQLSSVTTTALGKVTQSLTTVGGQVPVVGKAVTGLGASFGTMAGLATVSVAAIGAVAAGIFKLARDTAAYADNFDDLSQQLGVSTTLLSTLKVATETAGASFEGSTSALAKYLKSVSDANTGNEKLRQKFIQVGFSQRDLTAAHKDSDTAIEILIDRIGELSNDQDRLNALQKIGVRNGQELNGVIKAMDGDFAEFQKRVAAMGLLITPEQAASAREFEDSLKFLELTIKGLVFTFGREFIPVITSGMNEMQSGLQNNESAWNFWAKRVREEIIGVRVAYAGLSAFLESGGNPLAAVGSAVLRSRELKSLAGQVSAGISGEGPSRGISTDGEGGAKAKASTALQDALKASALAEKEALQLIEANVTENKRALDEQVRDITEFTERAKQLADDRLNATIDRINSENEALETALRQRIIAQQEYDLKDRELTAETKAATQKNSDEHFALEQERDRKIAAAEQAARERRLQLAEEADQRTIERVNRRIEREVTAESEGQREIATVVAEGFARKKQALEDEQNAYSTNLERRAAITDELVRLEGERAYAAEQASQRVVDAVEREARARFDAESKGFGDATRPRSVNAAELQRLQEAGPFQVLGDELNKIGILSKETSEIVGNTLAGAFQSLAVGVGQALQGFLMFGKVEGGFRKLASEIISSLAASAAIQAIYQLAQGLAWLALNAFFPNPKYAQAAGLAFASAAVFGAIGGAASVAAIGLRDTKSVAGGAFMSGDTRGGSSSSTTTSGSTPETREVDRRVASSSGSSGGGSSASIEAAIEKAIQRGFEGVVLRAQTNPDKFIDVWVDDYRSNGRVRKVTDFGNDT